MPEKTEVITVQQPHGFRKLSCAECRDGKVLGFDISMAFQPIVDINKSKVFAYEALVRTPDGGGAGEVFKRVNASNMYLFDQTCRVKAIELAAKLNMDTLLSINFMPNAIYKPELCIRTTLEAAKLHDFPINNIIFEFTEGEQVADRAHLANIVSHYQSQGFFTAIDDFGAGYSGLNMLADLDVNLIKLDMDLIRDIHLDSRRQLIVEMAVKLASSFEMKLIAEGIENKQEFTCLKKLGVTLMQGYYLAKPSFESLPSINPEVFQ
jgi:EAL domain-containing protein (putative c-di-GMP-specific phosphodiesterase class I)